MAEWNTVRGCIDCGAMTFVGREVDNHIQIMNFEPDPDGDLRIVGDRAEEPTVMWGKPTTTLGGFPLKDLTTYSAHFCDGD